MIAYPAFWLQLLGETSVLIRDLWRRNRGNVEQTRRELRAIRDHWAMLAESETRLDERLSRLEESAALRSRAQASFGAMRDAIMAAVAELPADSTARARLSELAALCESTRQTL